MTEAAKNIFSEDYYRNIFEAQKAYGQGSSFAKLDVETVKTIINRPWAPDGSNFSVKIWKERAELVKYLDKELTQAFIRGENGKTARVLTAWIDDTETGEMRLITLHVD